MLLKLQSNVSKASQLQRNGTSWGLAIGPRARYVEVSKGGGRRARRGRHELVSLTHMIVQSREIEGNPHTS